MVSSRIEQATWYQALNEYFLSYKIHGKINQYNYNMIIFMITIKTLAMDVINRCKQNHVNIYGGTIIYKCVIKYLFHLCTSIITL